MTTAPFRVLLGSNLPKPSRGSHLLEWVMCLRRAGGSRFCVWYSRARHYAQLHSTSENRPSLPHHRLECLELFCIMRKVSATSLSFFFSQRYMETEEQRILCISINWIILRQSKILLKFVILNLRGEKVHLEVWNANKTVWDLFFTKQNAHKHETDGFQELTYVKPARRREHIVGFSFFFHIHLRTCMEMESRFGTVCDTSCARRVLCVHRHYLGFSHEQQTHMQIFHLLLS